MQQYDDLAIGRVATYVFTTVALLCWERPALQELLLLVGLVSSVAAGKIAVSIPLLVVLAFFASQHGLRRHFIPIIIGAAVVMVRATAHEARWASILLVAGLACGIGVGFGSAFRWIDHRRKQAEKQAADALEQAAHAREEERQQLAAELHDVVAKDLTVITMLAGSLRLNTADEDVITASKSIETTSRTALDDLQRLLLVLRNQNLPLVSSPTHEDSVEATVAAMVTRLETLGWHVDWSVDCEPMPVSVSDAVNRILDESTANAIKHNGPTTAKIIVRDDGDETLSSPSPIRLPDPRLNPSVPPGWVLRDSRSGSPYSVVRSPLVCAMVGGSSMLGSRAPNLILRTRTHKHEADITPASRYL